MTKIWLGLGSNEGDRLAYLQRAIDLLVDAGVKIHEISPVVETASHGFAGNDFLNAIVYGGWSDSAYELLTLIDQIESKLHRKRYKSNRYANRTVDIDILLFGEEIIDSSTLQIPHPRMLERRFVLAPFAAFMPDTVLPTTGITIGEALAECVDESTVLVYADKLFVRHQL